MQLLTVRDVLNKLKISKSFLYKLMRNDESFPKPSKFSKRNVMFRSEDIDVWVSNKFNEYNHQLEGA